MDTSAPFEALRARAAASRHDELGRLVLSRKRKLQELYDVSRSIRQSKPLPGSGITSRWRPRDGQNGPMLGDTEQRFLEENDLERGNLFKEPSLPMYFFSHSGHPPEPGGQANNVMPSILSPSTPIQQLVPLSPLPSISGSHTGSAQLPSIAQAPTPSPPHQSPIPQYQPDTPPANASNAAPEPSLPATPTMPLELMNGHLPNRLNSPPTLKQRGKTSGTVRSITDAEQELERQRAFPLALSPFSRPESASPPSTEGAAPIVNIGSALVLQNTAVATPMEQEKTSGGHLPPVPSELDSDSNLTDAGCETPSKSLVLRHTPPQTKRLHQDQILNLQESSSKSFSTLPLPHDGSGHNISIQGVSVPLPRGEATNHPENIRLTPQQKASAGRLEMSSPASSIDMADGISTPGNIISSATSPDANQLPHFLKPERVSGMAGDTLAPSTVDTIIRGKERGEETEVEDEGEEEELDDKSTTAAAEENKVELQSKESPHESVDKDAACLTGPTSPVSPDPSLQLRLESQMANGHATTISTVPDNLTVLAEAESETPPSVLASSGHRVNARNHGQDGVGNESSLDPLSLKTKMHPASVIGSLAENKLDSQNESPSLGFAKSQIQPDVPKKLPNFAEQPKSVDMIVQIPKSVPSFAPSSADDIGVPDAVMIPVDEKNEAEDDDTVMEDVQPESGGIAISFEQPEQLVGVADNDIPSVLISSAVKHEVDDINVGITVPQNLSNEFKNTSPTILRAPDISAVPILSDATAPQPASKVDTVVNESGFAEPSREESALPNPLQVVPSLFAPTTRTPRQQKSGLRAVHSTLRKVVITSEHHAAALAEAEAKRLREDQEQQGLIVVERRRNQQAAAVAGRGRSSLFPPGSKLNALTKYSVEDGTSKEQKSIDPFDTLYTIKSMPISVGDLLLKASKTVTTANHDVLHHDRLAVKVLTRIQDLQDSGLWSFYQIAKAPEPRRKVSHWDYLLREMDWLSEDFRQERRWKISQARMLVNMVRDYHQCPLDERNKLLVDRKRMGRIPKWIRYERRVSGRNIEHQPTLELVASGGIMVDEGCEDYLLKGGTAEDGDMENDMMDLDNDTAIHDHIDPPPAAVFSLEPEELVFSMPPSKIAEETLAQLPLFSPPAFPTHPEYIEEGWSKSALIPVSKYSLGRMVFTNEGQPTIKRTRYDHKTNAELYADDSDEEGEIVSGGFNGGLNTYGRPKSHDRASRPIPLHPEQNTVALFRPEFKPVLQRVRNHIFRPPLEQPPQVFFEYRAPSLWTSEEDEKLRLLAKEYNHNWTLVSEYMDFEGEFHPGAERRSAWECFERWIGIENIPQEFAKSPHYRAVQQRLDIAARASNHHVSAAASGNQQISQLKRRGTVPTKVDRRRITRPFSQFEAMRKLAKKRETTMSKQAQSNRAAQAAAMRKQSTSSANPSQMRTPHYFSAMKQEREAKAKEQKQLLAQMGRNAQAGVTPHSGRLPNGVPATGPTARTGTPQGLGIPSGGHNGGTPNGMVAHAGRAQNSQLHQLQAATMAQFPSGVRHGSAISGASRHLTQNDIAAFRHQALRQQHQHQLQQQGAQGSHTPQVQAMLTSAQQAALGGPNAKSGTTQMQTLPTQAELTMVVQRQCPDLSQEQASVIAAKQLNAYHNQLSSNMVARNPAVRAAMSGNAATAAVRSAATGVLIGANGPIGPGAAAVQQQQQLQQQGLAGIVSTHTSRGGTPGHPSPRVCGAQIGSGGAPSPMIGITQGQSPSMGGMQSPRIVQGSPGAILPHQGGGQGQSLPQ